MRHFLFAALAAVACLSAGTQMSAAPDRIIASHSTNGAIDRTRPLCPYPLEARWNGSGSIDDAAAFTCSAGVRP